MHGARSQEQKVFGTKLSEDAAGLPRLYSKQAPARGWEGVEVPPWVQRALTGAAGRGGTASSGARQIISQFVCVFVSIARAFLPLVARC